jgi:hypothetical protein
MSRLLIVLIVLLMAAPALAQSATPSPMPTATPGAQGTLQALPTYSGAIGGTLPTLTPFPTHAWPTLTPAPIQPREWMGTGVLPMTPGGAYVPPPMPALDAPDAFYEDTALGFQGINDGNITRFMVFLMDVAIGFYQWFVVNFPRVIFAARWFVIIMIVLYGVFLIWKGSKFAPPDAERDANPRQFFFRSFRMGGRYYYYRRGARKSKDNDGPTQPRLL